jgi:hypothetical protein
VAELVIGGALLIVSENLVGLAGLLEALLGIGSIRVAVRAFLISFSSAPRSTPRIS